MQIDLKVLKHKNYGTLYAILRILHCLVVVIATFIESQPIRTYRTILTMFTSQQSKLRSFKRIMVAYAQFCVKRYYAQGSSRQCLRTNRMLVLIDF